MMRSLGALSIMMLVLAPLASRAPSNSLEGTVLAFVPGESLTLVSEQTDPMGVTFPLRNTHIGSRAAPVPGARVKVWYRMVGERHPITERVRVLIADAPTPSVGRHPR